MYKTRTSNISYCCVTRLHAHIALIWLQLELMEQKIVINLQLQVWILIRKMSWYGGDWMCGVCEHINFKKRETCQSCRYPKYGGTDPSTYRYNKTEALAGDWFCNCGAHNYASRSSCYRCGAIKDYYCSGYGTKSGEYGSYTFPLGWKNGDWLCPRLVHITITFSLLQIVSFILTLHYLSSHYQLPHTSI